MTLFPHLLQVFNEALLLVGEQTITEHDNSAFAAVYRGVAESTTRRHIENYNWDFARRQSVLELQGQDDRDQYVYLKPTDLLKIRTIKMNGRRLREFQVVGNSITTCFRNVGSVTLDLDYTYPAPVSEWSAGFYEAMKLYFEGLIRKSVLQDIADGQRDMDRAVNMFIEERAREFNSTGDRERNDGGSILEARQGFGRHG